MISFQQGHLHFTFNAAVIFAITFASPGSASTIQVGSSESADFEAIQLAIDASTPGDSIVVESGTYFENLDFVGKSVRLISQAGPELTTIDGNGEDAAVITINNAEDSRTLIQGFTITGGRGHGGPPAELKGGGGVFVVSASPTIRSNRFIGNRARDSRGPETFGFGGAIYCGGSQPSVVTIEDNYFYQNEAAASGGAIGGENKAVINVRRNRFEQNLCSFGDGGAVWILTITNGSVIRDNEFVSNTAGDHGGAVYLATSNTIRTYGFELDGNIFFGNIATSRSLTSDAGGGCWISSMTGLVRSNSFVANRTVSSSPADGSAIVLAENSVVDFQFNLLALNRPGAGMTCESSVEVALRHNLFWANLPSHIVGMPCSGQEQVENLVLDPQLCDSLSAEASVASSSPALNYEPGVIGAVPNAGCLGTAVEGTTWSAVKLLTSGIASSRVPLQGFRANATQLPIGLLR